jgi:Methyladenine glycosylase
VTPRRYGRGERFEHRILRCLASIHGIDISADNVTEAHEACGPGDGKTGAGDLVGGQRRGGPVSERARRDAERPPVELRTQGQWRGDAGSGDDLAVATPESRTMAKELKRRGFRFVGPTTAYSLMEAAGLVNDHLEGCQFRALM